MNIVCCEGDKEHWICNNVNSDTIEIVICDSFVYRHVNINNSADKDITLKTLFSILYLTHLVRFNV